MKRIIVICMLDSIHSANWIARFKDSNLKIDIYPSKKYRYLHPELHKIVKTYPNINLATQKSLVPVKFIGFLDYFVNELSLRFLHINTRLIKLQNLIRTKSYNFIHALEIQSAGYLCNQLQIPVQSKLIVTNWGSDIFYFQRFPEHQRLIRGLLRKADRYSAECKRDYCLARKFGFKGMELPLIPNSGGNLPINSTKNRLKDDLIVAKCYGGEFGRGDLAIGAVKELLKIDIKFSVYFYSVSPELEKDVRELQDIFPSRVQYSTIRNGISHDKLMKLFDRSRIYLGCSKSDGISTSFLEAISHEVFPVQTNTSCVSEWVKKGMKASIVPLNRRRISEELIWLSRNQKVVEMYTKQNIKLAIKLLDPEKIKRNSENFYID